MDLSEQSMAWLQTGEIYACMDACMLVRVGRPGEGDSSYIKHGDGRETLNIICNPIS